MLETSALETEHENGWISRRAKLKSDRDQREWELFAAVPDEFAHLVSNRPDNFLSLILGFGMVRNEQVDLSNMPTDSVQIRNLNSLFSVLGHWDPRRKYISPLMGPVIPPETQANGVAAFYSGGLDSLFTLVRHSEERSALPHTAINRDVDYAIHMFYYDNVQDLAEIEQSSKSLREGAEALGATFVPVVTNFYLFDEEMRQLWGSYCWGPGMGSILHFLSGGIGAGLIGSGHGYRPLDEDSCSPTTDHLMGSEHLQILHDGATYNRVEKTEVVATSASALKSINVCDRLVPGVGYSNCSRCEKCLRTMVTLDILGKSGASACPSFDWSDYKVHDLSLLFLRDDSEFNFVHEIIETAQRLQRDDVVQALQKSLKRSSRFGFLGFIERKLRESSLGRIYRKPLGKLRKRLYRLMNMRVR